MVTFLKFSLYFKRFKKILVLIFAIFLVFSTFASDIYFFDCKGAIKLLDESVSNFSSYKGNFIHSVSSLDNGFTQKEEGIFFFKKGKMRWEYQKPEKKVALYDGKFAFLYMIEDNILYKIKVSNKKKIPPFVKILLGEMPPSKNFFCSTAKKDGSNIIMEIGYFQKDPTFKRVIITVDENKKLITKISFINQFEERVTFEFFDIQKNLPIDEELFKLNCPISVKVVEDEEGFQENLGF